VQDHRIALLKRKIIDSLGLPKGFESYVGDQLAKYLAANPTEDDARLATKEHKDARMEICNRCDYITKVKPKAFLPAVDGCGICTCVLATKARMIEHFRIPELIDDPLTEDEVKRIKNGEKVVKVITECPKKKWTEVDKKYN